MTKYFKICFIFLIWSWNNSLAQELRITSYNKIGASIAGLNSLSTGDRLGSSLSIIGDIDKNGVNDLAIGANQDDDGGNNRGSVYILFLDNDSSIVSVQKISDTEGGFTGILADDDHFGSAVAPIGDLNSDGIEDIAVGALYDGDGAHQSGAVWILFLNNNGTVKSYQKISNTEGNFTGNLVSLASFGCSLAALGDLNKDGTNDIIVGAYRDNSALQSKSGSAWIIFLNNNGTVQSYKKIGAGNNGFNENLAYEDYFGGEISIVNDYDQNGIPDIAISAHRDDDGGVSRGAVYIISLDANGLVIKSSKISNSTVNFEGQLEDNDYFGTAICSIGDIDNDGNHDLLIGSQTSAGGGTRKGAFYILHMDQTGSVNSLIKYKDDACNNIDLNDNDMLGSNAAFINSGYNKLEVMIAAPNGDDLTTDTGVIYNLTLSTDIALNAGSDINSCNPKSVFLNAEAPDSKVGEWTFYKGSGNILEPNNPKTEVTNLTSGINQLIWKIQGSECPYDTDTVTVSLDSFDQNEVDMATAFESFSFPEQTKAALINLDDHSVRLEVKCNTDISKLTANFTLPNGVQSVVVNGRKQVSGGSENSFEKPVVYEISNFEKCAVQQWTIFVSYKQKQLKTMLGESIPNVITPDNHEANNTWEILSDTETNNIHIRIFNRWGSLVFEDENYKNDWGGETLRSSVYFYTITSKCSTSDQYKGWLHVIK